jgi:hypothetical protein
MGERDARICGLDARIVPLPDYASENIEIDVAR